MQSGCHGKKSEDAKPVSTLSRDKLSRVTQPCICRLHDTALPNVSYSKDISENLGDSVCECHIMNIYKDDNLVRQSDGDRTDDSFSNYNQEVPKLYSITASTAKVPDVQTSRDGAFREGEKKEKQRSLLTRKSSWNKVRNVIHCTKFVQLFKKKKYPWIQLVGHQGNFVTGSNGTILKLLSSKELHCFNLLMDDVLESYVPQFYGVVNRDGNDYVLLEDLLCGFCQPNIMDIKIGVRTYLEEELIKANESPVLRKDMYLKMIEVDKTAPTKDEHIAAGVTKARYMKWRETVSSSSSLGFRIEGTCMSDGTSSKDFKTVKSIDEVSITLEIFIQKNPNVAVQFEKRLKSLRECLKTSSFFSSHEVVGSSLLFIYDVAGHSNIWMIDFGKSTPLPADILVDHRSPWREGNREDGYLFGLDNLISIFQNLPSSHEPSG